MATDAIVSIPVTVLFSMLADRVAWGALAIAATLGAMVFFSAFITPLVFIRLNPQIAARFIRALFPWYYAFGVIGSGSAALLCAAHAPIASALTFVVCLAFIVARQALLPAINAARDAAMSDSTIARRFERLHRASVALNVLQMLLLALAFAFAFHRA
ncbi:MAG: DUF4149 domain-containing protein [Proteobacteria bacterium]|nr:DUF4149 domain-containing protein [Burkholderiales bacterium]